MDESQLPRDWETNVLETSFYRNKNTSKLLYVERIGDEFFVSYPDSPSRERLKFLPGQCKPFVRVDPWEYIGQREREIANTKAFIQARE